MKRGKDEEKIMGPMFPRLHVNDADRGGPRAPPRNKMALYEQLSIPSQKYGSGVVPLNPKTTTNMVPSASSSRASSVERKLVYPLHLSPSAHAQWSEKFQPHHSDVLNGNASEAGLKQREKGGQDEDFMVPVFVQARVGQSHGGSQNGIERETVSSISSTFSGKPVERQSISKDPKHNNFTAVNKRQEVRSESNECMKACGESAKGCVISATDRSTRENTDGFLKEAKVISNQQHAGHVVSNLSGSCDEESCLHQESRTETRLISARRVDDLVDSTRDVERVNASQSRSESHCEEDHSRPNEPEIDTESNSNSNSNRICTSSHIENVDKGDDVSETSMVDSISGLDISPDDVVEIIGQKHFWKARRAITHQQRMFAVQVFELHRLIKVQRLIAGSPHLMLEDGAFLGKSSLNGSSVRKLTPEYVVKSPPHVANCKDDFEKSNHKMECSAENAVGKTSLSSVISSSQSMNYGPYMGNPRPVIATTDNKIGPWCFHQSPGPQWLVPVMSPSEGLVYRPYPAPGVMGTACGGYGPFGFTPVMGNFMNSAYGVPASHQGIGVLPGTSPVCHTYFHPYGMPVMSPAVSGSTVEQANPVVGPSPQSQTSPVLGGGGNLSMEQQSSCNAPTQQNVTVPLTTKLQASNSSDLQRKTNSSPGERAIGVGIRNKVEGRDPFLLFPMASVVPEGATQSQDANQPTRVIKVVPHNPRSATESAARIFRFIQEERKQFDAV